MTDNRLAGATSPYLLQHKDNPVAWRQWGPEALAEAREAGKPILLSVGYAACHWCHVMAHESFEDDEVAAVMNELFVSIKVDREERPDIDQIYMSALHALGEQGGWPLTMFLTSDAEPFWGGTYFPKTARWGRPGFIDVLHAVATAYRSDRERIEQNRAGLMARLRQMPRDIGARNAIVSGAIVAAAGSRLGSLLDPVHGGLRGAPKFPQAPVMELLWRAGLRSDLGLRDEVLKALREMSNGGIYDHLGGGLSRYSVDERWLVPHFEKMLYDNAQYLRHLSLAIAAATDAETVDLFRRRLDETVAWLLRDMRNGDAFASSLDADSEGVEGKYYVWQADEVVDILGPDDATLFNRTYDISNGGNFEGANIPNRLAGDDDIIGDVSEEDLKVWRDRLLAVRSERVPPERDDKVLADWNGHMISALAEAALLVSRESWRDVAVDAWHFIEREMDGSQGLAHAWREGRATRPAFATDHAALMRAALSLAETAKDSEEAEAWVSRAMDHAERLEAGYAHENGGYCLTSSAASDVIVRPYSPLDEAVPNANAVAAEALLRLWTISGRPIFRSRAEATFNAFAGEIAENVFGTAGLLSALDTRDNAVLALIVTADGQRPATFDAALRSLADPALVTFLARDGADYPAEDPRHGKIAQAGRPTLYLCREGACAAPLTDPSAIAEALAGLRSRD
jgi:uncharacterized protein YyaL (SSP411 family)